jgi:hypothetical protein
MKVFAISTIPHINPIPHLIYIPNHQSLPLHVHFSPANLELSCEKQEAIRRFDAEGLKCGRIRKSKESGLGDTGAKSRRGEVEIMNFL